MPALFCSSPPCLKSCDYFLLTLTDVRKALKGLERCAKTSVLGATRAAKRALESSINSPVNQSTSGKATAGALNYSSNMIGTKFFKRGGRELGSTAFPENGLLDAQEGERAGQQDAAGGEANHFYRAAGMVFGLALVHRVINRYSADQEDRTQLLVRISVG